MHLVSATPWHRWVQSTNNKPLPKDAVYAGFSEHQNSVVARYIIRAHYNGELTLGVFIPSQEVAYIAHYGVEAKVFDFEVLCGEELEWAPEINGMIPAGAVSGGRTTTGNELFVARAAVETNLLTPGKIQRGSWAQVPYSGKELAHNIYEVLTTPSRSARQSRPIIF